MHTYIYSGPIFRFEDHFDDVDSVVTQAPTINKAYTNILYKLKCYYGIARDAKLSIDKANIVQVKREHTRFCKECGALLTNTGDCPVCDFGENSDDFFVVMGRRSNMSYSTINNYRRKHKRCRTCKYSLQECGSPTRWECTAKCKKIYHYDIKTSTCKGMFCKLYEAKLVKEN